VRRESDRTDELWALSQKLVKNEFSEAYSSN